MSGKVHRAIRERLHAQDPHCYWCGRLTRLVQLTGGDMPDDAATLDHFRARPDPLRQAPPKGEPRHVLACHRCNNQRGDQDPHAFRTKGRGKERRKAALPLRSTIGDLLQSHPLRREQAEYGELVDSLKSRPNLRAWGAEERHP